MSQPSHRLVEDVTYDADTAGNLANVENLVLTASGAPITVTLGDAATFAVTGIQHITNTLSAEDLTVNGVAALVEVSVINAAGVTTVAFRDTVLAGSTDTVTLNVNGATAAIEIGTAGDANGDFETLVINTSGAASSFAAAGLDGDVTTLTITGSGDLTLTGAGFANLGTLNAGSATGDISVILAADAVAGATNTKTLTLGSGDDSLDISRIDPATVGAVSVNMGSGDDTVILGARGASDFTINGGAGTDSVSISVAASAALHQGVSGFERLIVTDDVTSDMVQFTANSGFTILRAANAGDAGTTTFSNVALGVNTLELQTANDTDNVTLSRLNDTASDSLAIVTRAADTLGTLSIADEEIVSINSTRGALELTDLTSTDMTSLTVAGTNAVNIGTSSGTSVVTVDVSGLSAAFTGTFTASTAAMTVTGNGNVGAGVITITTGLGNDVITGGRGADDITSGAGNDTVRGGRGNDTIDIGTGSNTLIFEATGAINGLDTITGFNGGAVAAGGDVLNFANFMSGGSVDQNGGATTAITMYTADDNNDVNIANKVVVFNQDAVLANAAAAINAAVIEIQGANNAFNLASGGKSIVIIGNDADEADEMFVIFVDDTVGETRGTIEADDMSVVMVTAEDFNIDTLTTANFAFV